MYTRSRYATPIMLVRMTVQQSLRSMYSDVRTRNSTNADAFAGNGTEKVVLQLWLERLESL